MINSLFLDSRSSLSFVSACNSSSCDCFFACICPISSKMSVLCFSIISGWLDKKSVWSAICFCCSLIFCVTCSVSWMTDCFCFFRSAISPRFDSISDSNLWCSPSSSSIEWCCLVSSNSFRCESVCMCIVLYWVWRFNNLVRIFASSSCFELCKYCWDEIFVWYDSNSFCFFATSFSCLFIAGVIFSCVCLGCSFCLIFSYVIFGFVFFGSSSTCSFFVCRFSTLRYRSSYDERCFPRRIFSRISTSMEWFPSSASNISLTNSSVDLLIICNESSQR